MLSNDKGAGFTAQGANVVAPTTAAQAAAGQQQIDKGTGQVQSGIDQQQNLVNALQAQGGLNNQSQVYNQLQGVANGTGPNPAQAMLAQQTGANTANQAALMAGQRGAGANAGLIARQAAAQGAANQQQAVGQGATMQANQSLNAIGQAGALANQQAANQIGAVSGLNSAAQGAQGLNINAQGQTLGAIQGQNQANVQNASQQNQANAEIAKGNQKGQQDLVGGLLNGISSAAGALSDERQKTDIRPADGKINQFLDNVGAHEYEYKDSAKGLPGAGQGKHVSPMAQELEHSELGKEMVVDGPNGKSIDYGKGLGTILAAQSTLHKRLEQLEAQIGGKSKMAAGGVAMPPQATPQPAPQTLQAMPSAPMAQVPPAPVVNPNAPKSKAAQFLSGLGSGMSQQPSNQGAAEFQGASSLGSGIVKGLGAAASGIGSLFSSSPTPSENPASRTASSGVDMMQAMKTDPYEQQQAQAKYDRANPPKMATGGKVPAMVSPGEVYLDPKDAKEVSKGKKSPMSGEMIKGKAKVKGDSLKNDTVPKTLDAGGVVIPRSIIQGPNAHREAYKFVNAVMAKHGMKAKSKK